MPGKKFVGKIIWHVTGQVSTGDYFGE